MQLASLCTTSRWLSCGGLVSSHFCCRSFAHLDVAAIKVSLVSLRPICRRNYCTAGPLRLINFRYRTACGTLIVFSKPRPLPVTASGNDFWVVTGALQLSIVPSSDGCDGTKFYIRLCSFSQSTPTGSNSRGMDFLRFAALVPYFNVIMDSLTTIFTRR